jgi:two component transcriptional regulator
MNIKKVLIADDEPMIREGLRDMLMSFELNLKVVGEAKNGLEALGLSKTLEPDIILADICMPKLSGLDFIKQLKQGVKKQSDIIIISGFNEFEYARQAISLGVNDYLLKPVKEEELKASIKKCRPDILEMSEGQIEQNIGFTDECLELLKESYQNKDISLKTIAFRLSINPDYLSHKLKEETGFTFKEWLTKLRIKRASELLEMRKYTVYEVADMVGYSNQHYFSTVFKQYTGKSPKNYNY